MFDMIRKIWKVGTVTRRQPFSEAPLKYKGKIKIKFVPKTNWAECAAACPSRALIIDAGQVRLFYGNCIMCGNCVKICNTGAISQTNDCYLAVMDKNKLWVTVTI